MTDRTLAYATNAPRALMLGDSLYFIGRWTPFSYGVISTYLDDMAPGKTFSDPEATEALGHPLGRILFLWAALYVHNKLTLDEVTVLAARITDDEYEAAISLFLTQSQERYRKEPETRLPRRPRPWSEIIHQVCEVTGWTYDTIIHMSLDQLVCARSGGKLPDPDERILSYEEVCEQMQQAREQYQAEHPEEAQEKPGPPAIDPVIADAIAKLEEAKACQAREEPFGESSASASDSPTATKPSEPT